MDFSKGEIQLEKLSALKKYIDICNSYFTNRLECAHGSARLSAWRCHSCPSHFHPDSFIPMHGEYTPAHCRWRSFVNIVMIAMPICLRVPYIRFIQSPARLPYICMYIYVYEYAEAHRLFVLIFFHVRVSRLTRGMCTKHERDQRNHWQVTKRCGIASGFDKFHDYNIQTLKTHISIKNDSYVSVDIAKISYFRKYSSSILMCPMQFAS